MNTSAVVPFYFQSHEIRTITIDDSPWFVAKDVCDVLGLENVTKALQKIPEKHLALNRIQGKRGEYEVNTVDEPGLYRLVLRSDKLEAEPFMEWITAEVLPAIRKTGSYALPKSRGRNPLWPDNNEALALAKTREGERMARELKLGAAVAQVIGLRGRRQVLEKACHLAAERTGTDPLRYFGLDLDEYYPQISTENGCHEAITRFIDSELLIADQASSREHHQHRVRVKKIYEHFVTWYSQWVDARLRGVPSMKTVNKEIYRRGGMARIMGGVSYVYGVYLMSDLQLTGFSDMKSGDVTQ